MSSIWECYGNKRFGLWPPLARGQRVPMQRMVVNPTFFVPRAAWL
jgi:hypothetical protein